MPAIKSHLRVGIEVHQAADQPTVVKRSVTEFMKTLAEAVAIVLLVATVLTLLFLPALYVAWFRVNKN